MPNGLKHIILICLVFLLNFRVSEGQTGFSTKQKNKLPTKELKVSAVVKGSKPVVNNLAKFQSPPRKVTKNNSLHVLSNKLSSNYSVYRTKDGRLSNLSLRNHGRTRKAKVDAVSSSMSFIDEIKPLLNVSENSLFNINHVDNHTHKVVFSQVYKGIEVYGSEVVVSLDNTETPHVFSGVYSKCDYNIDVSYNISSTEAIDIALKEVHTHNSHHHSSFKGPFNYEGPKSKKIIYEKEKHNAVVAYEINFYAHILAPMTVIVDGQSGEVLKHYSSLCSIDGPAIGIADDLNGVSRNINTFFQDNTYLLADITKPMFNRETVQGAIFTYDAGNTQGENAELVSSVSNQWRDPAAVSAHHNAGVAYDYFFDNHRWNSINGEGGNIISLINVSDEFGESLENAFWNGQAIFYGNGGTAFKPLAGSIDVAGHEMTHGVIQNTANLEYQGESGAINESMADIFGFMMDQEDWQIGEDVVKPGFFPSGALRDLENPNQGGTSLADRGYQPAHVNEQYFGDQDNGGVHINSGIPNHAFFLLAERIGNEGAADIFFLSLSKYLTRFSKFVDLRIACIQSATDIYGRESEEVRAVESAFDQVGIEGDRPTEVVTTLPPSKGDEFLLSVDTDQNEINTLFRSSPQGEDFIPLTTTPIINRPSVTKDGTDVYYIGSDSIIYHLDISDINNPKESIVNNVLPWSNVAVSKNGNQLAAVTGTRDTAIYVLNFESGLWAKFELYNPTFTEGLTGDGPIYADALEWDFTGEFLVYDAFNRLGDGIDYWDVNFINVWDLENNNFGTGNIEKLFSSLPEGVSIGNPAFSKNSPYILAFDFVDGDEYAILGVDIQKNEISTITQNNVLGFPNYSNLDNSIAFTTRATDIFNRPIDVVASIGLDSTKLNANTEAVGIINHATWAVFYTNDDTQVITTSKESDTKSNDISIFPNPSTGIFNLASPERLIELSILDTKGRNHPLIITESHQYDLHHLPKGIYFLIIKIENGIAQKRFIKH